MNTKEEIINEINDLLLLGQMILYHETIEKEKVDDKQKNEFKKNDDYKKYLKNYKSLKNSYQNWYSKSMSVIKQILPDRYNEFVSFYSLERRKEIDSSTYTISDYLIGLSITRGIYKEEVVDTFAAFFNKFESQLNILSSCISKLGSILDNIEGVLQSNLFENEIEAAKDLLKKKHIRASGVLSGVVLESHLTKVCENHGIKFRKKNPTISDFNEELKKNNFIDIPTWRLIQRLGDIRNMSAHPREREPKIDEVDDLIRGTEKIIAELF